MYVSAYQVTYSGVGYSGNMLSQNGWQIKAGVAVSNTANSWQVSSFCCVTKLAIGNYL